MIKLNEALEAMVYESTLAVFAGDRSLTFEGIHNIEFFKSLKQTFSQPRDKKEIKKSFPHIHRLLSELLATGVLIENSSGGTAHVHGKGALNTILRRKLASLSSNFQPLQKIVLCFPDNKGLGVQQEALQKLKKGEQLLTGIRRGTTFFVLPLVTDKKTNLKMMFHRLLSTEPGIGNLYLADELSLEGTSRQNIASPDQKIAEWVVSDIFSLLRQGRLDNITARIYRASSVLREDISFANKTKLYPIFVNDTIEEKAEALIRRFVGKADIVSRYDDYMMDSEDLPLYFTKTETARAQMKLLVERESLSCWGIGETRAFSRLAAIMESIERYSIESFALNDFPLCPMNALPLPALDALEVAGFSKEDCGFMKIAADEPRRWHKITSLEGKEYMVPLELIRYPAIPNELTYTPLDHSTSSGVAAHFSWEQAVSSACHELIERDAFMIAWLRQAAPPIIRLNSLPDRIKKEVDIIQQKGWKVRILNLTLDLAPVICVLISNEHHPIRYSMGASSKDNIEDACLKALREAFLVTHLPATKPRHPSEILEKLRTPADHIGLYATGEHDDLLLGMFGSSKQQGFTDIQKFDGKITDRIRHKGLDVFTADMMSDDLKLLAPEISVVRAIVPGLVPIQFGKAWMRTGSSRIKQAPEQAGWKTKIVPDGPYQSFPHPFP